MNERIRKICSETVYNICKYSKIGAEVIEKIYEESKKQDS